MFQGMRQQQLFEITGMDGQDYTFTLSGIGREQAAKRLLICHYIGSRPRVGCRLHRRRPQPEHPLWKKLHQLKEYGLPLVQT
jgi:hypothetical protein